MRNICNSAAPSAPPAGRDSYSVCVQFLSGFTCPDVIMTGGGKTRLCGLYNYKISIMIYGADKIHVIIY